jgi:LmbE family N-acetylglucosaminyl deacetylase
MRFYLLLVLFLPFLSFSQPNRQPNAAQIQLKLQKLNFLGSVLYMAAHPDDENTNIIAYLSNEKLATTAYLSLTRGDGGQNLIGPEIRELLGLIRTQELLAARSIDGGQQFFTRAIDFGFSKSASEAFSIWGKESVLSDAIRVVRQFQPDIIITRFPPDERAGHGHHTASAILAGEAFDLAARKDVFPEQVEEFGTWQVKRLYTNTGRWWNRSINELTPGVITIDVGGYNTFLGKSYSEISALSSSQHKSQGWGRRGERGYRPEFLEPMKGDPAKKNIFEGVDTTWNRIPGGEKIAPLVAKALEEFDARRPEKSVSLLFSIRNELKKLDSNVWRDRKLRETEELIVDCLGLFAEVTASSYQYAPGESVQSSVELLNRSNTAIQVRSIKASGIKWDSTLSATLTSNRPLVIELKGQVDAGAQYSDPYWLQEPHSTGMFKVSDKTKIGMPQNSPSVTFVFDLMVDGQPLSIKRSLLYKWVDPVKGELWRPFEIVPPVTVNLSESVVVFGTGEPKQVAAVIRSSSDNRQQGTVRIQVPKGWRVEPATVPFDLTGRGEEQVSSLTIYPSAAEFNGVLKAIATVNGKEYDRSLNLISYDHFPIQTLLPRAEIKAVRIDLKKEGQRIGYIRGAGDDIPSALRNIGYDVWEMNNDEITPANLRSLDAVVLGVRALNTNDRARYFMPAVLEYVREGGTAIVQYNTNARLQTDNFAPYPINIGRDRVTDERSPVQILLKDHPVVNKPNKITNADFEGWIQERGLYFPSEWDKQYEAVLSMGDPGESPKSSSLLVAKWGKGHYVYTGLSFFRELPEGVPGAYKLFANLVSLRKTQESAPSKTKDRSR